MKKALIKKKLVQAGKARLTMAFYCEELAEMLQPYFPTDIWVTHQPSDGFVIVTKKEGDEIDWNISIVYAIEKIKKDESHYRDGDYHL